MEACPLRMRLRKRSSDDSMRSQPRSPTTQILGRTKLDLPDTSGRSSFYLATHWTGHGFLRHYLHGLHTLERHYMEMELLMVAGTEVKGWSHSAVSGCLQRHLVHVTSAVECKMILRVTDYARKRHLVEIQFDILTEDGVGVGDKVRAGFDLIVRVVDSLITKPDITDVTYQQCCYIRVRHGALTGRFLHVSDDHTLSMDERVSPSDYVFKCYTFFGHNHAACRRGRGRSRCPRLCRNVAADAVDGVDGVDDGGVGDGSWPQLCVLQDPRTCRYVMASALSHRLTAGQDAPLHTDIASLQQPDPRFFILHRSGNGDCHQFCLTPVMLCNYFLRYDAVEGLKLERCDAPPFHNPSIVRQFAFEFMPAADAHH